ncbi:uncharacterized protein [Panulirus ornatus]|uniref:uncharacterized protein isoform X3 n=1 Tax=Panulirus ornatus TaxID=150431 RepID=UPI003A83DBA1
MIGILLFTLYSRRMAMVIRKKNDKPNCNVPVAAGMEKPLPLDDLLGVLENVYEGYFERSIPDSITSAVKKIISCSQNSEEATLVLDKFSRRKANEKKLQVTHTEVPTEILPDGFTAVLHDIKVHGCGPDDRIYNVNPDIRKMIPRGATTMQLNGVVSWFDVVIYGNKKFTGGIGDEDQWQPDDDDKWREYCLENPDTARKVVCMTKLNGEAAHFSGRYIDGQFYIFTGSKNVHMMIRDERDIDQYHGSKFGIAKVIAKAVCDTLKGLEKQKLHLLLSLLHHTKCTAVCEILQPEFQHIVNIHHYIKPQLFIISFTYMTTTDTETSLTAIPPHHALDLAIALGLNSAPYTVITTEDILKHRNEIRQDFKSEGEVLYFLNQNEDTIGLAKIKTTWYVLLRALREKAVRCFSGSKKTLCWNVDDHIVSTHKRFLDIQKWLKFSSSCLQQWKVLSSSFLRWLNEEIKHKRAESSEIRPKFPLIWEQFLKATNQTDRIEA